ncbi:hypothetical protein [Flavobacterium hydatis]|uniref:hypothetical protein n=1 Tax=Flavobacterium hydatis TaxID=991 RepID=UPI000A81EE58|nr:hypothetical protein [Flavobacterium hydatis]
MNLNDFIEKTNDLGVVALECNNLKEVNGGIGGPASRRIPYEVTAEDVYLMTYQEIMS